MATVTTVAVACDPIINSVIQLMKDVINMENDCQILQTDLRGKENLLQDVSILFRDPQKALPEFVKIWLQLLQNSLADAKRLLDRWGPRQSCLDCVVRNPRRFSKDVREWSACFDKIYHGFQSDLSMLVTSLQFVSKPLYKKDALLQGSGITDAQAPSGFVGSGITDAQAKVERWLNEGDRIHLIGVYGMPGVGKTSLLKMVYDKYRFFDKVICVTVPQDCNIFHLQRAIGDQLDIELPDSLDERKMKLSEELKWRNFLLILHDLPSRLDLQELGVEFGDLIREMEEGSDGEMEEEYEFRDHKHSKVLFSARRKDLIQEMGAEESIEIQPLSKDEAWMLFRKIAFKDEQVSMDIEERARRFADECKGVPLVINIIAAMIGQISVDEWDRCFSLKKNVDPSFPATHPSLDAEVYTLLRWSYDALPNPNVQNCFLYCAMYEEGEAIDSRELVEMWIGEGLVKSKQGTYLMDMAIGRNYLKLLLDRCLFQRTNVSSEWSIRVHHVIRDMAMYIGQQEQNWLFMAGQTLRNFAHDENCRRISFARGDLPTDLRCPQLATLILKGNRVLKELPSEFLLSPTSLRVLNLSGCTQITSVPRSIGQLRMLEFLSLSQLPIKDLPEEICHLSELQFLDLSSCLHLESLPSQIGELKNLKHLNLNGGSLYMILREISELTSLRRLQALLFSEARLWSLKGLKNLTELNVLINTDNHGIKDGIMGTWSEMRHLYLQFYAEDPVMEDLPQDMQNMKKLQSFMLGWYKGLSLPNCKFEHLERVELYSCENIMELCPLERLPNLKLLKLYQCRQLRELGLGSPSGYPRLEKLVLSQVHYLKSLGGESNAGVWDERTLPHLRVLKISRCPSLKRFPIGMEKLRNLCAIKGDSMEWWESIMWEDDHMKAQIQKLFIPWNKEW